jgi:membrane fusion protein (multidrug efflux system)
MTLTQRRLSYGAIALLVAAGALFHRLSAARDDAAAAAGTRAPAAVLQVDVITLRPEPLSERLTTSGTIRADEEVEIVSEISGKVVAIDFREGHLVRDGALLVKIDDTELVAERDRAAYRVSLAERAEARQRRLLDEGLVSDQEYDFALNELNVLRAEQKLAEAQLIKTSIQAPFGGVIGLRNVSLGSYLTPAVMIATLQRVNPVKLDFSLPEKYAGQVQVGDSIQFRTKGDTRAHAGTVIAIEPRVDRDTRSLTLRASSPNPDGALVPGAFADVEIEVSSAKDALAVPARAVIPELGGKKLFVAENGQAQVRRVETGLRTAELLQVTSGVEAGEQVIVSAIQQLRPGLAVEVIEATQ